MSLPTIRLDTLLTGRVQPFTRPGTQSAIDKQPQQGQLKVCTLGLHGDEQGDLRVHGGVEKAIHHYPLEHYARWADELGAHPLLTQPGAFGENFSTTGWSEHDVCLGDRIRVGTALLEVSQGRMPCWKLSDRFAVANLALEYLAEVGPTAFARVFAELMAKRDPLPFLGDMMFHALMRPLIDGAAPLLTESDADRPWPERTLALTPLGVRVLNGRAYWPDHASHPRWVGGVQIVPGQPHWTIDAEGVPAWRANAPG